MSNVGKLRVHYWRPLLLNFNIKAYQGSRVTRNAWRIRRPRLPAGDSSHSLIDHYFCCAFLHVQTADTVKRPETHLIWTICLEILGLHKPTTANPDICFQRQFTPVIKKKIFLSLYKNENNLFNSGCAYLMNKINISVIAACVVAFFNVSPRTRLNNERKNIVYGL